MLHYVQKPTLILQLVSSIHRISRKEVACLQTLVWPQSKKQWQRDTNDTKSSRALLRVHHPTLIQRRPTANTGLTVWREDMGALRVFGEPIRRDASLWESPQSEFATEIWYGVRNDSGGHQLGHLQDMAPCATSWCSVEEGHGSQALCTL